MGNNILIHPIFIQKSSRNDAKLLKAKLFIQMKCGMVAFDYGVELQDAVAEVFCGFHAVHDQLFTDMLSAERGCDSIAGVADMPAAADIVWMQDIKPDDFAGFFLTGNAGIGLGKEKCFAGLGSKQFCLWKSRTFGNDTVPDIDSVVCVFCGIVSDVDSHSIQPFCFL